MVIFILYYYKCVEKKNIGILSEQYCTFFLLFFFKLQTTHAWTPASLFSLSAAVPLYHTSPTNHIIMIIIIIANNNKQSPTIIIIIAIIILISIVMYYTMANNMRNPHQLGRRGMIKGLRAGNMLISLSFGGQNLKQEARALRLFSAIKKSTSQTVFHPPFALEHQRLLKKCMFQQFNDQ